MTKTYNGWTNHSTWDFICWHGDSLSSLITNEIEIGNEVEESYIYDMVDSIIQEVADSVEGDSYTSSIVLNKLSEVDIDDIANSYAHQAREEMERLHGED